MTVTLVVTSGGKWGLATFEIKNILNVFEYGMTFSPMRMDSEPCNLNVYFSKRESSEASMSSPTFSITRVYPNYIVFSRCLINSCSDCRVETTLLSISFSLIHLFAYPCGSMRRGHRCEVYVIIPFSREKASRGRPLWIHLRMEIWSPSVASSE
jgi:hypothetical protein